MTELDPQAEGLEARFDKMDAIPCLVHIASVGFTKRILSITHLNTVQWIIQMPLHATVSTKQQATLAVLTPVSWLCPFPLTSGTRCFARITAAVHTNELAHIAIVRSGFPLIQRLVLFTNILSVNQFQSFTNSQKRSPS